MFDKPGLYATPYSTWHVNAAISQNNFNEMFKNCYLQKTRAVEICTIWYVLAVMELVLVSCLSTQHTKYYYRSVPLIHPPILYTTSSLKWGEGLYSNMQLVSNISPPPPPRKKKVLRDRYVHFQSSCLHKNTVTKAFYTKQLIQTRSRVLKISLDITFTKLHGIPISEKSCQFNARSITFTTASL